MRDYRNINAYKHADELAIEVYKTTKNFPKEESFGLTSQLRRAAVSSASNIVEGSSRQHKKDYLNFFLCQEGLYARQIIY